MICANTAWNLANFRSGLIRGFIDRGDEVIAVAPPDAEASRRLEDLGCRFEPLPMESMGRSPLHDLLLLRRFRLLMRRAAPDVFLGYTIKPNIYGSLAAQSCGIPVINNISGLGTAFLKPGWLNRVVRLLYRAALHRSRHVFFQNPDDRDLFAGLALVDAAKTSVLPGSGIDLQRFAPRPSDLRDADEGTRFLMIARLLRDKGLVEYVEAARLVKARRPSARFGLLGFLGVDNPSAIDRATLDAWIAEGVVDYAGSADDVRPFIAACDCVVLPSYREGTPRTLLEAAAMAKPLIATDVPGCREVVEHGVNGFLCGARDAASLAESLDRFIGLAQDDRLRMGRRGRAKVEREFDERIVIARYQEEIDRIARGAGAPAPLSRADGASLPGSAVAEKSPAPPLSSRKVKDHERII